MGGEQTGGAGSSQQQGQRRHSLLSPNTAFMGSLNTNRVAASRISKMTLRIPCCRASLHASFIGLFQVCADVGSGGFTTQSQGDAFVVIGSLDFARRISVDSAVRQCRFFRAALGQHVYSGAEAWRAWYSRRKCPQRSAQRGGRSRRVCGPLLPVGAQTCQR